MNAVLADRRSAPGEAQVAAASPDLRARRKRSWLERWNRRMIANALRTAIKHVRRGESRQAMRVLGLLSRFAPKEAVVQVLLAKAAWCASEPYITRVAISALLVLPASHPYWMTRAANLQVSLGDFEGADATLALAKERFPTSWVVWKALGMLNVERSRAAEALICFRCAVELATTPRSRAEAMYRVADCLDETGQRDQAISTFQEIIELIPYDTLPHSRLVECQHETALTESYAESLVGLLRSASLGPLQRRICTMR